MTTLFHVLCTNDDGIAAIGLQSLFHSLQQAIKKHPQLSQIVTISMVAPSHNRSGMSQALTLNQPLNIEKITENQWQVIDGTPADCVHFSCTHAIDWHKEGKPSITHVLSGINHGVNLGDDTLYSGTVGAAIEGNQFSCHGYAFSFACPKHIDDDLLLTDFFAPAVIWVTRYVIKELEKEREELVNQSNIPIKKLVNINIPAEFSENNLTQQDAILTRLGKRKQAQPAIKIDSPRGGSYFWIGQAGGPEAGSTETKNNIPTDFEIICQGLISETPLQTNLTDWNFFINNRN